MRLRAFGFVVTLSLGILAVPLASWAQPAAKIPRIGFLCARPGPSSHTERFEQGLRELGYVPGKNIAIEYRFAPGDGPDPFPGFAAEMVRLNVDVIVAASPPAIPAAKQATRTIPIVFAQSDDPVGSGFVTSLARPGGNITGLSSMAPELSVKQLDFVRGVVPNLSRVAILWNGASTLAPPQLRALESAARGLGISIHSVPVRGNPRDFDQAFGGMKKAGAGALIVFPDMMFFDHQQRLVKLAAQRRIPTIYGEREFAETGGMMAYGTNYDDLFRRAATYVAKILKGAKPADLPVEQPMRFELLINLKTAKAFGLTIPQSLLLRADEVIQ